MGVQQDIPDGSDCPCWNSFRLTFFCGGCSSIWSAMTRQLNYLITVSVLFAVNNLRRKRDKKLFCIHCARRITLCVWFCACVKWAPLVPSHQAQTRPSPRIETTKQHHTHKICFCWQLLNFEADRKELKQCPHHNWNTHVSKTHPCLR